MSLAGFVADARRRVAQGYYHTRGEPLRPTPFSNVFEHPEPVVAEVKPRSPSEGVLTTDAPDTILEDFVAGGAAGLSVLTDPDHFDGSIDTLRLAHGTGLPVLFKDFVIDAAQVACAAHHGCAAVLLIERILDPAQREALVQAAHDAGMQVLLEIHSEAEWATAQASAADVIGVNARDLDTLRMDPDAQAALVEQVQDRPVMSLSGIRCRADRLTAETNGADAVLVGTSLVRHRHRKLTLTALRRPLAKVCGIARPEDLQTAVDAGADMAGFVVLSDSPRAIELERAEALVAQAHIAGIVPVLVTRHADMEEVLAAVRQVRPDFLQWHGHHREMPDRLAALGVGLLTALGPGESWARGDGFVLDSADRGQTGGTGKTHDWALARRVVDQHPGAMSLIAGGLGPDNVAAALAATCAWGADASSGLESTPGVKDPDAVRAFVQQAQRP